LPGLDHIVEPALVGERQYRSGSPKLDVAVQGSQLAIGELAGVALLQLIEHRSASSFGLQHQPLADFVPDGFEWILARAVGTRSFELLAATILPPLTGAG